MRVSVLRRPHENECAYAHSFGCSTAHGHSVRVLQLHPIRISLCRRSLHFHVSAAASALPTRGIYVVGNEKVRGVLTPLKRAEGVKRGQGREDDRGRSGGN